MNWLLCMQLMKEPGVSYQGDILGMLQEPQVLHKGLQRSLLRADRVEGVRKEKLQEVCACNWTDLPGMRYAAHCTVLETKIKTRRREQAFTLPCRKSLGCLYEERNIFTETFARRAGFPILLRAMKFSWVRQWEMLRADEGLALTRDGQLYLKLSLVHQVSLCQKKRLFRQR